jgi:hypothetical protein
MWLGVAVGVSRDSLVKSAERIRGGKGIVAVTFFLLFCTKEAAQRAGALLTMVILGVGATESVLETFVGAAAVGTYYE